jgi:hypothetical protein
MKIPCSFDPKEYKRTIGLFDCPLCGKPVMAGKTHLKYDDEDNLLDFEESDDDYDYCDDCDVMGNPKCNNCLGC